MIVALDIHGILERAGADADAAEGTQAWALAQVDAAVAELIECEQVQRDVLETCQRWFAKHSPTAPLINGLGDAEHPMLTMLNRALARVGGAK
jgi:hypothetical protein